MRDPAAVARSTADGRMGYLLYRQALARRLIIPMIGRLVFAVGRAAERELLAELPGDARPDRRLDRRRGPRRSELNAADFMVAPSLALILYRPDVLPLFEGRPALELVDRLLPEP